MPVLDTKHTAIATKAPPHCGPCLQIHLAQATSPEEMWVMWSSGDYFTGAIDTAALGQAAANAQPKPRCYYSKRSGGPYKVKKGCVLASYGGNAPAFADCSCAGPGARSALGTRNASFCF
jgi:hypothetical protein